MKQNLILFFGIIALAISCTTNDEKTNLEPELSKALFELKELGNFKEVEYEYLGGSKKPTNQNNIKITFTNSALKDLNEDEFGKQSARKIYNLNTKTKKLETIWITIKYAEKEKIKKVKMRSVSDTSIDMSVTLRNFIYQASELELIE